MSDFYVVNKLHTTTRRKGPERGQRKTVAEVAQVPSSRGRKNVVLYMTVMRVLLLKGMLAYLDDR